MPEENVVITGEWMQFSGYFTPSISIDIANKKDTYQVPYKTVMDKTFKNVDSSAGPFNRNYVLVTPGKSNVVANETGIVFAERIFYELFYLAQKLSEQSHNYISAINDSLSRFNGNNGWYK